MKVAITGATGFVGSYLVPHLSRGGADLVVLTRNPERARRLYPPEAFPRLEVVAYSPLKSGPWQAAIDGCDGAVNLAGAPIADERWTPERKREIRDSRKLGTERIVEAIAKAENPPAVLVNSSAVGYYGTSETATFDESSEPGKDFLAEVCKAWETAANAAANRGTRVAIVRTGIVVGRGGAVEKMLTPFKLFAGGPLGSGQQWFSWIHVADLVAAIARALRDPSFSGPYNATAPNPVRMAEFCQVLGEVLQRPSWLPVPGFALELLLGDAAKVVLEGQKVVPDRLLAAGFEFEYPTLKSALEATLLP